MCIGRKRKFFQVSGPEWLKYQRWDIVAKTHEAHTTAEFRGMMRALLAEWFHVVLHTEEQVRPVYELVLSKGRKSACLAPATPGVVNWLTAFPGAVRSGFGFAENNSIR